MTEPTGDLLVVTARDLLAGAHYDQCGSRCWPENPPRCVDCSGLVTAVRRHAGLIGDQECDGSFAIMRQVYATGQALTIDQARHTPSAVVAQGINNGRGGIPGIDHGHIGFSVGDGIHTLEARGHESGVGLFLFDSLVWDGAGVLPGVGTASTPIPTTLPPYAMEEESDEMIALPNTSATLTGRTATARAVKNFNFVLLEDGARVVGDVNVDPTDHDKQRHWWAPLPKDRTPGATIVAVAKSLDGKSIVARYANPDGSSATYNAVIGVPA